MVEEEKNETTKKPQPQAKVEPLPEEPTPQWDQHKPAENDEMQVDPTQQIAKPTWWKQPKQPDDDGNAKDTAAVISDLERALLPEWFDGSAAHRTPATYVQARQACLQLSSDLGHNRYVTATMVRRTVPGDAGSLLRLHQFLTAHALSEYEDEF